MTNITIGVDERQQPVVLPLSRVNRHGLIAGATGGGKTVTLQVLAEQLNAAGVPVLLTDIKGDLSGMAEPSDEPDMMRTLAEGMKLGYQPQGANVVRYDPFGQGEHSARLSCREVGPDLMARALNLTPTQTAVMDTVFDWATLHDMEMDTLEEFEEVLRDTERNTDQVSDRFGYVSRGTIAVLRRAVSGLRRDGGDDLFGIDWCDVTQFTGSPAISVLDATRLYTKPRLYAIWMMAMLRNLRDYLPEVGDPTIPKLAVIIDEAHLLFRDTPKHLVRMIEDTVRLIRSKGVGIYFVTQYPTDLPTPILGQLGNRVQHALRGYTAQAQTAIKATARSMPTDAPDVLERQLPSLKTGQAFVSFLDEQGQPSPVRLTRIRPPASKIGAHAYEEPDEPEEEPRRPDAGRGFTVLEVPQATNATEFVVIRTALVLTLVGIGAALGVVATLILGAVI